MRVAALTFAVVTLLLISCSGGSRPAAVPKPTAYPRVADPGTVYSAIDSLPLHIEANTAATVSRPSENWIDISYPAWHVTVHVTLSAVSPDNIDRVIANRTERMALNITSQTSVDESNIESSDFTSLLLSSPDTRSTPLQFLASDGQNWVVSGAAFFDDVAPDAPVDSLAQVVGYLSRDLRHTLSTLARK